MAATLAHPLSGALTTDPGTARDTDRPADAVLRTWRTTSRGRTATTAADAVVTALLALRGLGTEFVRRFKIVA